MIDLQVVCDVLESQETLEVELAVVTSERLDPVVEVDEQFPSDFR